MEIAATFFFISVGLAIWIIGILTVVVLIQIIKLLKSVDNGVQEVKNTLTSLDTWKTAIMGTVSGAVNKFIETKTRKGGGKRD